MEQAELKKEIIGLFLKKNILLSSDIQEIISIMSENKAKQLIIDIEKIFDVDDFFVFSKEMYQKLTNPTTKETEITKKGEGSDAQILSKRNVEVIFNYDEKSVKRNITHFTEYFRKRYKAFEQMLQTRQETQGKISISRAKQKQEKETVSIIGMINNLNITKNGHFMINVEDLTGSINVFVNKNREDLFIMAKNLVYDEVIGIEGTANKDIIFANNLIQPDIPLTKEFKKSPVEEFAVFIGDPHFGSNVFLKKEFNRLINWLRGEVGDAKQKNIASKVKYLFIVGDIVEGVGIYPGQEEDLEVPNIYEQYNLFTEFLKKIPEEITVIISPGNHDAMRLSEPQPALSEEFSKEFKNLPNIIMVSNPAYLNIGRQKGFDGFDILIYHGYSFPYYADKVESIRSQGGLEKAELIMQLLLKKRHLAPSHTSNLYIPDTEKDPLIIDKIPDFFVTGHIHRTTAKNYKQITLLNCSCWIGQTPYQEKVGLKPQPARLPIVNLKTREVKIMKFGKDTYTLEDTKEMIKKQNE